MKLATIGIIAKPHPDEILPVVPQLLAWLKQRHIRVLYDNETARCLKTSDGVPREQLPGQVDLVIVLGGDGTLLAAARVTHEHNVPILGVNLGSLGFLTEITLDEMYPVLEDILADRHKIDRRRMLEAGIVRAGETTAHYRALNDVVLHKAALARMIDYAVEVDNVFVSMFRADGLIVSTPTGSTAYSLAAGGPILFPSLDAFLITPICPHMLTNRPLVIPGNAQIEVKLKSAKDSVYVTVDGQVGLELHEKDILRVAKSDYYIQLIVSPQRDYFQVLRSKLRWGEGRSRG